MEGLLDTQATSAPLPPNLRIHQLDTTGEDDLALVREGLAAPSPWLHPRFFYDATGSALFDAITRTPEYYPTRVEASILDRHLPAMLDRARGRRVLVEPGSGSCEKAQALLRDPRLEHYVPIEISRDYLVACCERLAWRRPELMVDAICGDFVQCRTLPRTVPESGRLVFFPGSTIGNFDPDQARDLLANFRALAGAGGHLLVGTDLPKEREILEAAYNDAEGLTARFNLNMLEHLNRRAHCQFDTDAFDHRAYYNEALSRIEMHLVCRHATNVQAGDYRRRLEPGDSLHTESSYKYEPGAFLALARGAGLEPIAQWHDDRDWFAVHLLRAT